MLYSHRMSRCLQRCALFFLLLMAVTVAEAQLKMVAPRQVVLQNVGLAGDRETWHSEHFQILVHGAVKPDEVKKIAVIAETTHWLLRQQSLPLAAPASKDRALVEILADSVSYVRAGGIPESAGCYLTRPPRLLLDGSHYFASAFRAGRRLPAAHNEDLVVHELVHLCMHGHMGIVPQWVTEGVAEYFSCMHSHGGNFVFTQMEFQIRDHIRVRAAAKLPQVPVTAVEKVAVLDSRRWLDFLRDLPAEDRQQPYATALLLVHYYIHGGKDRRQEFAQLLQDSLQQQRRRPIIFAIDAAKTSAALRPFWKEKGLPLRWVP